MPIRYAARWRHQFACSGWASYRLKKTYAIYLSLYSLAMVFTLQTMGTYNVSISHVSTIQPRETIKTRHIDQENKHGGTNQSKYLHR